jgi:nuclear GTP-binding protein
VLNKVDLVPEGVLAKWITYLKNEFPTVPFKSSTQNQADRLQVRGDAIGGKHSGGKACFGAPALMSLLGNYCRSLNLKRSIRVGVVGYPNVGKSSLINSLKRSRVCGVGSTPGFTKSCQEIALDKHVQLIDSPGIIFGSDSQSGSSLVLRNCVRVETLADPITPVGAIIARCGQDTMRETYAVPKYGSTAEFLALLARRMGRLLKGGDPDCAAAARVVLNDWNCGKISFFSEPPETHTMPAHISASVVCGWGEAFDLDHTGSGGGGGGGGDGGVVEAGGTTGAVADGCHGDGGVVEVDGTRGAVADGCHPDPE